MSPSDFIGVSFNSPESGSVKAIYPSHAIILLKNGPNLAAQQVNSQEPFKIDDCFYFNSPSEALIWLKGN